MNQNNHNQNDNDASLLPNRHWQPMGGSRAAQEVIPYYLEPLPGANSWSQTSSDAFDFLRLLRARKFNVLAIAVLGAAVGILVAWVQTPLYKARTKIEIQSMAESDALYRMIDGDWRRGAAGAGSVVTPESYLETQLHVLQSDTFRKRVTEKLSAAPRSDSMYEFSRPRQLLAMLSLTNSGSRGGLPPATPAARIIESTRLVELTCDSPDPAFAAEYVNTTADEFVSYNLQLQSETASRTLKWLTEQLEDMRRKVEVSKTRLEQYSRETGLQFEADKPDAEKSRLKDLERELAAASVARIETQSAYEVAVEEARKRQLVDERIGAQELELLKLKAELSNLRKRYTPEHTQVRKLETDINTIERMIEKQSNTLLLDLRRRYEAAHLREERLLEAMNKQTELVSDSARKGMEYDTLRRELERNRKLYEDLLQKATEVSLSTAMRASSQIRIVDSAKPPQSPFKPNILNLVSLGLATGLMAGVALVFIGEKADKRLRRPGEIMTHLGIPELAVVPKHEQIPTGRGANSSKLSRLLTRVRLRKMPKTPTQSLVAQRDRQPFVAESFRGAVASILASVQRKNTATRLLVTSPLKGDGKSTVVVNLAMNLTEIGYSVLIIDGDLREPKINGMFDLGNTWGLTTLVSEDNDLATLPLEALYQKTVIERLCVLTAGPGPESVSRILHSRQTALLLERLSKEFDFILIDTPPVLEFSDARLLGRLVDAAIIVVKANATTRDDATSVLRRLMDDSIPVMGTILNQWERTHVSGYGEYGYQYSQRT